MESIKRRPRAVLGLAVLIALVVVTTASGAAERPVKQIVVGLGLTGGGTPDKDGVIFLEVDPEAIGDSVAGDFIQNGTSPQDASFNVTGSAVIGSGLGAFTNKLRVAGGNWNPNDSDTDVLIGDSLYRLKIGIANGGAGAGDARIRAQGGTNRVMIGGGANDTLTVTPERVGVGTPSPARTLDVAGDAHVSGSVMTSYGAGSARAAPIAYGVVRSDGTKASGTPNFTSSYDGATNIYFVDVAGHNINLGTAVVVQPSGGAPVVPTMTFSGDLGVRLFDLSGATVQRTFSFVVYRP